MEYLPENKLPLAGSGGDSHRKAVRSEERSCRRDCFLSDSNMQREGLRGRPRCGCDSPDYAAPAGQEREEERSEQAVQPLLTGKHTHTHTHLRETHTHLPGTCMAGLRSAQHKPRERLRAYQKNGRKNRHDGGCSNLSPEERKHSAAPAGNPAEKRTREEEKEASVGADKHSSLSRSPEGILEELIVGRRTYSQLISGVLILSKWYQSYGRRWESQGRQIRRTRLCILENAIEDLLYQKNLHEPLFENKPFVMSQEDWNLLDRIRVEAELAEERTEDHDTTSSQPRRSNGGGFLTAYCDVYDHLTVLCIHSTECTVASKGNAKA
ncbi:hypothetical protein LXL04_020471 [Taraxacum kok-saghyz]